MRSRRPASAGCLAAAGVLAAVIWFVLPHEQEVTSAAMLLFKLTPFAFAVAAIALADDALLRRLRLHLVAIPAAFLLFFCFFVPRIFFYSGTDGDFPKLYYHMLTAVPLIILALVLSFRLGGGAAGTTARLGFAMLLLMLSGLEDLAFLLVNPITDPRFRPIPDVWPWASHIKVFLGHAPTKYEAYAFIAVHVVLAAAVLFVPGRWLRAVVRAGPFRRSGAAPRAVEG
jgi:hypothetical protein